ncbi:hypothetical protein DPMN_178508 [Dreissena polymorpha]|uniref:Uncharacterized protein n=1 Tax=Dreissena polymorpha TaxID=45954 RepID=A0A9D4EEB9_DREPO|nr:hypothetical protein DPMN_178508 [Dreissena polymorpha]
MTPDLLSLELGRTIPGYLLDLMEFSEVVQDVKSVVSDNLTGQSSAEQFVISLPSGASGAQVQFPDTATPAEVKHDVAARPKSNLVGPKLVQCQQLTEQYQSRQGEQEHRLAGADRSCIFFLKVKGLSI